MKNESAYKYDYRLYFHLMIAIFSWLLFFYLWYLTFATRFGGFRPLFDLLAITVTGVVISIVDIWWIRHNVNIFKKKGPRRAVPESNYVFNEDVFGRKIKADWRNLAKCNYLHIASSKDFKWYFEDKSGKMRSFGKVS